MGSLSASETVQAPQAGSTFAMNVWTSMKELTDLDYESWRKWKLDIQLILALMDMDLALLQEKPLTPTSTSSPENRSKYEKWERSNRLCLLIMKSKISANVYGYVPDSENAKDYLARIDNLVMKFEQAGSFSLAHEFASARYDGDLNAANVRQHIMKMSTVAKRLKGLGYESLFDDLNDYVIKSLPPRFNNFTVKALVKNWGVDEIIANYIIWEQCFRQTNEYDSDCMAAQGKTIRRNDSHGDNEYDSDSMALKGKRMRRNDSHDKNEYDSDSMASQGRRMRKNYSHDENGYDSDRMASQGKSVSRNNNHPAYEYDSDSLALQGRRTSRNYSHDKNEYDSDSMASQGKRINKNDSFDDYGYDSDSMASQGRTIRRNDSHGDNEYDSYSKGSRGKRTRSRKNFSCFHCGVEGHFRRDCPELR